MFNEDNYTKEYSLDRIRYLPKETQKMRRHNLCDKSRHNNLKHGSTLPSLNKLELCLGEYVYRYKYCLKCIFVLG